MKLKVEIVSPERTLYSGEVDGVVVPGEKGSFEILTNHAPIISTLTAGTIRCNGQTPYLLPIKSGFVEVAKNEVSICVEVK